MKGLKGDEEVATKDFRELSMYLTGAVSLRRLDGKNTRPKGFAGVLGLNSSLSIPSVIRTEGRNALRPDTSLKDFSTPGRGVT